jgi:hypothetical protein
MKFFTIFAALLAAFLCGCNTWVEEPVETSMTFDELEKKMRLAADPQNRYGELKSYQQTQIVSSGRLLDEPEEKFVTVKYLKPGHFAMTVSDEGGATASPDTGWIITPEGGWLIDYQKKKVEALCKEKLQLFRRPVELDDFVSKIRQNSVKVELSACRVNGEKEYYKLVCYPRKYKDDPVTYYVDKDTFLVYRMVTSFTLNGIRIDYETTILRYALKDGIRMPEKTVSELSGIRSETRLINYKLNPDFTAADFVPPVF